MFITGRLNIVKYVLVIKAKTQIDLKVYMERQSTQKSQHNTE